MLFGGFLIVFNILWLFWLRVGVRRNGIGIVKRLVFYIILGGLYMRFLFFKMRVFL